jgi:hypothetical protein
MPEADIKNLDDPSTAFPASETTPGQQQSRASYKNLERLNDEVVCKDYSDGSLEGKQKNGFPWWEIYLDLRAKGWTWRKAAFIAWSCVPTYLRIPKTCKELATHILGMRSDRIIRKWRENDPEIDKEIERSRIALLHDVLPDVLAAWGAVARSMDPKAHRDRITYLIHAGIYKPPKTGIALSGDPDAPPIDVNLHDKYLQDMAEVARILNPDYEDEEEGEDEGEEGLSESG